MRYLTLGISMLTPSLIMSCKSDIDYIVNGTYVYINSTDSLIQVKSSVYDFVIKPKQAHTLVQSGDGSKDINESSYVSPMLGAVLIFYNIKCDTLNSGLNLRSGPGITGIENYNSEKVADRHYKFTYTFTQADMDKAVACE
jgi:hypothetical protein